MKFLYSLSFVIYYMSFANQPNIVHIPIIQEPHIASPKKSTLPHIDISSMDELTTQPRIDSKILKNIINEAIQKNMYLNTACIPQQVSMQGELNIDEVDKLGMQLELTATQYKDNLLRLQNIILSPANKDAQKRFVLTSHGLSGVHMVMTFSNKGIKQHVIALSPNYMQIDNMLLNNTPQIFRIFQTYFCHARAFRE